MTHDKVLPENIKEEVKNANLVKRIIALQISLS